MWSLIVGSAVLQEVLMGKDSFFKSFQVNADNFICTLLPGISNHPQIEYSPGQPAIAKL